MLNAPKPLLVLINSNGKVSTKDLARQIGAKSVEPCADGVSAVAGRKAGTVRTG